MQGLRRFRYVLPNIFTLGNIFAGLYSIQLSLTGEAVGDMVFAAWMVVVAMACDLFDGRVARLVDAESEFGAQLDSLTDAVSFGVAPAMLMYSWGLVQLGVLGLFFAFLYTGGALMRLARFNVLARKEDRGGGPSKYFTGLPTPLAAGTVVSVVFAHASLAGTATAGTPWNVAVLAVLLGGLMVSNVQYRTFKKVDLDVRAVGACVGVAAVAVGLAVVAKPSVAFVSAMVVYIAAGLGHGALDVGRKILGEESDEEALKSQDSVLVEAREDDG